MKIKIILLFALVIAIGCSKKQPVQPPLDKTVIKGVVADSLTGQPLPGATVGLNTNSFITVTDSFGNYRFVGMGGGSFTVNAEKIDWRPNGTAVIVAANDSIALNIKLYPRQWDVVQIPLASPWSEGYLEDLCFINEYEGWAVGSDESSGYPGYIIHTTDGGYTWEMQFGAAPIDAWYFHNVDFVDNKHGWAVADANQMKRTTDGGITWQDISKPLTGAFWAMDFIDINTGWLAEHFTGSSIYKTTDGGNTWIKQAELPDSSIISIKFLDANRGLARSSRSVWATNNGGASWTLQLVTPTSGGYPYNKIETIALSYVWIEGYYSPNGGLSWEHQPSDTFGAITAISFCNSNYGWMGGTIAISPYSAFLISTTDSGRAWRKINVSGVNYIFAMQFINPCLGYAVGKGVSGIWNNVILIYK
jgi:photosystem II stability/assembly factor-like uncharacterized protein